MFMALAVLVLTLGATQPSAGAEIRPDSKIDAVTVFPRGAEVVRIVQAQLEKGPNVLIISDFPDRVDASNVRIEGQSNGKLEIGTIDTRRLKVPHGDDEGRSTERRRLEEEIEHAADKIAEIQAAIETGEIQKRFVENLAGLPTSRPRTSTGAATGETDWTQIFDLIGVNLARVHSKILAERKRARDAERRLADLKNKLSELAPKQMGRTEVRFNVVAEDAAAAKFIVRYQVRAARWQPIYDARLETGTQTAPAKLDLTRRASISQRTGENWSDVAIALSTSRPAGRNAAPDLYPITVDFIREIPPPRPIPPVGADSPARQVKKVARSQIPNNVGVMSLPNVAGESVADVEKTGFHTTFKVPGRVTIDSTNVIKHVKIGSIALKPTLLVRAVPMIDPRAYLYAIFHLPNDKAPLLKGQVMLFRDQTFIGKGQLPQLAGGDRHELGFGPDDAVRVRHNQVAEERGETGIISSSRTDQRKFKIRIKNAHDRAINYAVLDRQPEPLNENIKVSLIGRSQPTRVNVKDRPGVVAWQGKLEVSEEKTIDFGYIVSWPAGKQVQYNRQRRARKRTQ
ncbi:MAG: mucoidy inhibitor MuiA family protein [Hyphomicrobiaceae bacterium]